MTRRPPFPSLPARQLVAISLATMAFISQPVARADTVYKWQDENGKWHFSDQAPDKPGQTVEQAAIGSVNTSSNTQGIQQLKKVFPEETKAEAAHKKQQQAQQDEIAAERERICSKARKNLKTIEGRVIFIDANGKPETVSEEERIARAEYLRKQIARYCP